MLSLESPVWQRLTHAYGKASDVPGLLARLSANTAPANSYKDEPWLSLWSSLCHQGDVYTASYAALPHIVQIGTNALGPVDAGFFSLPACIEVARNKRRGPEIPPELAAAYFDGLRGLHKVRVSSCFRRLERRHGTGCSSGPCSLQRAIQACRGIDGPRRRHY